jgi:hypothetical protein
MLGNTLALIIAIIFGTLGYRSRIPAGTMIGALISVIVFNTLTGMVNFPVSARAVSQTLMGSFIGMSVTLEVARSIRTLIRPAMLLCTCMLTAGFAIGFALYAVSDMALGTALFSAAPGGLTDVTLVAIEMGGDASKMVILHIARLVCVILICPVLYRFIIRRLAPKPAHGDSAVLFESTAPNPPASPITYPANGTRKQKTLWLIHKNAVTIAVAGIGGVIGFLLNIPAGVLIFSMAAVGAFNIFTQKGYMSVNARRFAQILAGTIIGQNIGADELLELRSMLIPTIVLVTAYLLAGILTALLMHKICKVDLKTALFASTPAGAGDMAMIASDVGANTSVVAMLHIARLITVIALYPQITFLILHLTG